MSSSKEAGHLPQRRKTASALCPVTGQAVTNSCKSVPALWEERCRCAMAAGAVGSTPDDRRPRTLWRNSADLGNHNDAFQPLLHTTKLFKMSYYCKEILELLFFSFAVRLAMNWFE